MTLLFSIIARAEFYKVEIRRESSNLYQTREGIYIKTKFCYEYAIWESAILSYDKYSYNNKLIFNNGQSCEVEKILN
ncbi:hypothetical protein QV09_12185 [Gallibacterium salpingitidis]|uniref:Uncharacterized protein n=1 Tax=Gallibacterium salpingitidis TaxID=505341 RepID=A0AB36DZC4_9PAST|nr:hypothetical protein QV09_12185 [Gallibacterium salpingitidis]